MRAFLLALPMLLPLPLHARDLPCAPRDSVLAFLQDELGQTRRNQGHAGGGARMETYANDAGDWTVIVSLPDGRACLLAAGEAFDPAPSPVPARGRGV
jgi:hypothetical protein